MERTKQEKDSARRPPAHAAHGSNKLNFPDQFVPRLAAVAQLVLVSAALTAHDLAASESTQQRGTQSEIDDGLPRIEA
jgi:hypothetical protein